MIWLHKIWTDLRKAQEDQNNVLEKILEEFQSVMDTLGLMLLFGLMLQKTIIFDPWTIRLVQK